MISAILLNGIFFAQSFETKANPKITELQQKFKFKNYSKTLLSNFSSNVGRENNEWVTIYEPIPGEIIGWANDRSTGSTEEFFLIKNGKLNKISTIPQSRNFFNKVNKYAPKGQEFDVYKWSIRVYEGEILKKLKDGNYLIIIGLTLFEKGKSDDFNSGIGEYEVEYKTKDFKNFIPLKLREKDKENAKWIIIK